MSQGIYLDNNTATRPSETVIAAMLPFFTQKWVPAHTPHFAGNETAQGLVDIWKSIYADLGAKAEDALVITGSGAEAANEAIWSAYQENALLKGKNQFISAATDEAPAILSLGRLEQHACVARTVPQQADGIITAQAVGETMTPRTAMVSLSWANGLTGVIQPIAEIGKLCRERGVLFHVEASHVIGQMFFEWEDIYADFLSFGGESIHAPLESGLLWIRQGIRSSPLVLGRPIRASAAAGIAQALKEAVQQRDYMGTEIARLRDRFEEGILSTVPESMIFFREQERVPSITCVSFPGIVNEALLYTLNRRHVYASMGGGLFQQIALVLEASGIPESMAQTALSFGLSRETTEEEIDRAISLISDTVKKMRKTRAIPNL